MAEIIDVHCHCKKKKSVKVENSVFSAFTSILIVFLPKCSFCILSYSSTIALCSGASWSNHAPGWTSWISVGLSFFTLLMILLNYRDVRTWIAAALVGVGGIGITYAEMVSGDLSFYYLGASIMLLGVWVNGSYYYVYRRWVKPFYLKIIK